MSRSRLATDGLSRRSFLIKSANYAGLGMLTLALSNCGGGGGSGSLTQGNETVNAAKNINKTDAYDFNEFYDVCIIGGGSSGVGAAFSMINSGLKVLLIEKDTVRLGGTCTQSFVNNWAAGPDAPFSKKVAEDLFNAGLASFMSMEGHKFFDVYDRTLLTDLHSKQSSLGISFNIEALGNYYFTHISDHCDVWLGAKVVDVVNYNNDVLSAIEVLYKGSKWKISAKTFIDCSGTIDLFRMLPGESYYAGEDPSYRFNEDAAPSLASNLVNAPDLCYRIGKNPDSIATKVHNESAGFYYSMPPNEGVYVVNPTNSLQLTGSDLFTHGYQYLYDNAVSKVVEHSKNYAPYIYIDHAPMLGIRESYRAKCLRTLCQPDTEKLISRNNLNDFIAIADHYYDFHGASNVNATKLNQVSVYGVPYKCMVPVRTKNLLVACKGAGFSHIGASSCRLTKAMMQLGYSAGVATKIKLKSDIEYSLVNPKDIQYEIGLYDRVAHLESLMSV